VVSTGLSGYASTGLMDPTLYAVVTPMHVSSIVAHVSHQEHAHNGMKPVRHDHEHAKPRGPSYSDDDKAQIETFERA
jgi:hypothetical protein